MLEVVVDIILEGVIIMEEAVDMGLAVMEDTIEETEMMEV